jgi:hypothetical protein
MARIVKRTHTGPYNLARTDEAGKCYWYDYAGQRREVADPLAGIRTF